MEIVMKVIYFVIVLFVSFFLFTACGGEENCVGNDCFEPTDETSVTDEENVDNENSDETTDDVVDDVVDSEPDEN
ncbi:MAG: hypothetical protein Q7J14_01645, partial [Candidatus Magasanikbacteria bacterium]|nr:hypothetical protein [Candidatus Magasanikbacteria bacterium]